MFVLSAISPDQQFLALQQLSKTMRTGAKLLIRDYGRYNIYILSYSLLEATHIYIFKIPGNRSRFVGFRGNSLSIIFRLYPISRGKSLPNIFTYQKRLHTPKYFASSIFYGVCQSFIGEGSGAAIVECHEEDQDYYYYYYYY